MRFLIGGATRSQIPAESSLRYHAKNLREIRHDLPSALLHVEHMQEGAAHAGKRDTLRGRRPFASAAEQRMRTNGGYELFGSICAREFFWHEGGAQGSRQDQERQGRTEAPAIP